MTKTVTPPDSRPRQREIDLLADQAIAYYRRLAVTHRAANPVARRQAIGIIEDLATLKTIDRGERQRLNAAAVSELSGLLGTPPGTLGQLLSETGWLS